jgi:aspartate-semialdehyde dehydrogenase
MSIEIAIVGATGLVGQTALEILEKKDWSNVNYRCFASVKSVGKTLQFKDQVLSVEAIEKGCFNTVDYAIFSINSTLSKTIAKQAVEEGCIVIDNSSAFRFDDTVPLVVPSINFNSIDKHRLIANPNCSTIQSVIPLYVIQQMSEIKTIEYNTYQSVSGSGQKGIDALAHNTGFYPIDIRKSVYPKIDSFLEDGYTFEEYKMIEETKKILNFKTVLISASCVRVPVERGHGVHIKVVTKDRLDLETLKAALETHPMIDLVRVPNTVDVNRTNTVLVGRIKRDKISENGILLFVSADNLYVGAAANAIDILEGMIR